MYASVHNVMFKKLESNDPICIQVVFIHFGYPNQVVDAYHPGPEAHRPFHAAQKAYPCAP